MPKEKNVYCHNCDDHDRSENNAVRNFSHTLGVALSFQPSNGVTLAHPVSCLRIAAYGIPDPERLVRVRSANHPNLDTKAPSWETR